MARVIKFRAWDKARQEMIYEGVEYQWRCLNYERPDVPPQTHIGFGEVDAAHFLVEQFTGLTDKNGKEIYEGDIIEWDDQSKGEYWRVAVVVFTPGHIEFHFIKHPTLNSTLHGEVWDAGNMMYWKSGEGIYSTRGSVEVIGNIHSNPELLEAQVKSQ